ncbi:MAG: hypothetical protein E7513_06125 [Ruminococcaceae bacterium]|nr:hypothetical protein [Oscillospiraceae bacterium]
MGEWCGTIITFLGNLFNYIYSIFDGNNEEYINRPLDTIGELCENVLAMLSRITIDPNRCGDIISEYGAKIRPDLNQLSEKFTNKYYTRTKLRKEFSLVVTDYLDSIKKIIKASEEPCSNLYLNSLLTLINNQDYFVDYDSEDITFLDKVRELVRYYYDDIDQKHQRVCRAANMLNDTIL